MIDEQFQNHLTNDQLSKLINHRGYEAQSLFKQKVGVSMKSLLQQKRLMEGKKKLAFTDKSIKEIGYELGYEDPTYFNRVFKKNTGFTPNQFRENQDFEERDLFVQDIYELLQTYHKEEHSLDFYADKMHLSVKTLSKKVRNKLNISMGQMIRQEIINTAKLLLTQNDDIKNVAFELGFEEPNHFSSFFKLHTNLTPTEYKNKKYHS